MSHATASTRVRRLAVVGMLALAGASLLAIGPRPGSGAVAASPGIVRASVSSVANATATTVVTIAKPSGTVAGDTLVACLALNGSGVAGGGVPAGWTAITVSSTVSNPRVLGYYRVAGFSEPGSYSWLLSSSVTNGGGIARYTGVDTTSPLDAAPSSASGLAGTPATVPGVSTVSAEAMLVGCLGINSSSTSIVIGSPSGMTEAWDVGGKRHELADQGLGAAGPTGTRTWTLSSGRDWVAWLAALRPAAGAPQPTPTPTPTPAATSSPAAPTPTPTQDATLTYYVSPTGDDLGPGSFEAPWQTLQHALNDAPAAATIRLADGTYAGASWTRSGLTVVGGAGAIVTTPIRIDGVTSATLRGLTITTGSATAGLAGLRARNSSGVQLEQLTVSGNSWGVQLDAVTDSALRYSVLTDNADALEIQGNSTGLLISGNDIHDNTRFWAADRSSTGVTLSYVVGPMTLTGNRIRGNHSPAGQPADGVGIEVYATTGLDISGNTIFDNLDNLETGTDAAQTPCSLRFTGNVVYKSGQATGDSRGLILRCASDSLVANNTFDGLDTFAMNVIDGTLGTPYGGSIAGLAIRDNIIVSGRALSIDSALPASVTIDADVLYAPTSTALYGQHLAYVAGRGNTSSLTELRAWTGYEQAALWADPWFADAATHDYHLRQSSAAAGKGAYPVPVALAGPPIPRLDHVFVVVMENRAYSQVIGSPDAPYWNFLASEGVSPTAFSALTHPSLPNYLAMIGGSTFGITTDCAPADVGCSISATTLVDRIEDAGLTWRAYFGGMSTPCKTTNSGTYRVHHDPFVYFEDVRLDAARCSDRVRPFGDLNVDLASGASTPSLAFIVPDNCDNMHDCPIATGDAWLRTVLPRIFDSPAWSGGHSLLVLTFDEDDGSEGNRISTVLYGPDIRPHHQVVGSADLLDLLRTFEDAWSLAPVAAGDAASTALTDAFRTSASSDLQPPTAPASLTWTAPSADRVELSWAASSDATGVTAYEVFRDGAWLGQTTATTFADTSVTGSTTYGYRVRARDAELNVGPYSQTALVTTPAPPPTPSPTPDPPPPPSPSPSPSLAPPPTPSPGLGPTPSPSPSPSPTPSPTAAPAPIVRAAVSTVVNASATSQVVISKPAGTVAGDVLVACLALNGGGLAANGAPVGWSTIASVTGASNPRVMGYIHVAGAVEPATYTWTLSSSVKNGAGIARYSGVDPAAPLDGGPSTAFAGSGSSATLPGVTTSAPNAMLVGCVGINSTATNALITSPVGMTQAWDIGGKRHELADGIVAPAGPTGTRTWTFSQSRAWAGWLVALRD